MHKHYFNFFCEGVLKVEHIFVMNFFFNVFFLYAAGAPDAVTNITTELIHDEIVNNQWNTPFSIDIPTTDPDITYFIR